MIKHVSVFTLKDKNEIKILNKEELENICVDLN